MSGSQEAVQGWVALVGAGPGDEGLLTVRAAELLGQAGLVVAGAELEPAARRYMSQDATLADPGEGAGSARALVQAARDGQLAVRLFPGDHQAGLAEQLGRPDGQQSFITGARAHQRDPALFLTTAHCTSFLLFACPL